MTDQLSDYESDAFSQTGEDGVINRILNTIPVHDKWCVEFGAWDGIHLSNARRLIIEAGYSSVLIEGDKKKFVDLVENYRSNDQVFPINGFVGFESDDNLDTLLATTPIPTDFDFLSIDIDGNDYHVWDAVKMYKPKVVCIEFNPTIPKHIDFEQPADPACHKGASLTALTRLAKSKGYELVHVLPWNAIYVSAEYFNAFEIADNRVEVMQSDQSYVTWIWSGYDGEVAVSGYQKLLWHDTKIRAEKIQPLPRFLREYVVRYGLVKKVLFRLLKAVGAI